MGASQSSDLFSDEGNDFLKVYKKEKIITSKEEFEPYTLDDIGIVFKLEKKFYPDEENPQFGWRKFMTKVDEQEQKNCFLYKIHEEFIIYGENNKWLNSANLKSLRSYYFSSKNEIIPYETALRIVLPELELVTGEYPMAGKLASFMKDCYSDIFKELDESIENGFVPLYAVGYYFKKGDFVTFTASGVKLVGVVHNVAVSQVDVSVIFYSCGKFCMKTISFVISTTYIKDMEIKKVDNITRKKATERGRKLYHLSKEESHHLLYTGPSLACNFIGREIIISEFSNSLNTRVIIDRNPINKEREYISYDLEKNIVTDFYDDQFMIMLPFIDMFVLGSFDWIKGNIEYLQEIQFDNNLYSKLQIEPKYKNLLSLIIKHEGNPSDIVQGKGNGFLILLNGPPGVGKTLTAEAFTEEYQRPLINVPLGALGDDASKIERALSVIFKSAFKWKAVILLDEVDIFLAERKNVEHYKRNAIVGVFLRCLEYFQGIMFMTTNSREKLDIAFLSRITINLDYKPLSKEFRRNVWINSFEKMFQCNSSYFKDLDLDHIAESEIDGRKIRNVVKICLLLKKPLQTSDVLEYINCV